MNCKHCNSENFAENYCKSTANKTKRYYRYCKSCGYNSYYNFPKYLDVSQFDRYIEQINKKGDYSGILEI